MDAYEQSLKIYRDNRNTLDYARKEGWRQGYKEGFKEGFEKGKQEAKEKIAKLMKKEGEPIDIIIKSTGLSREQVDKL